MRKYKKYLNERKKEGRKLSMREPIHEIEKFTDLKDMLNKTVKKFGDRPAYVFKTEEAGKPCAPWKVDN